jgi:O-antigen chain-terminating methyltransferase
VDRDANLVADAKSRGFEAIACDVKDLGEHLTAPVDGVMVAHLIEHLSPTDLAQLFRDIAKLVRPGGVAILATPNFKDWRVASEWFWLDPTHVRPYPPGAIQQIINPDDWTWDKWDYEQISVTRELPVVWVKRLVFGWDYGRSGVWYRLTRNPCHAST